MPTLMWTMSPWRKTSRTDVQGEGEVKNRGTDLVVLGVWSLLRPRPTHLFLHLEEDQCSPTRHETPTANVEFQRRRDWGDVTAARLTPASPINCRVAESTR